jgi:SAM-dependent methyltransferase
MPSVAEIVAQLPPQIRDGQGTQVTRFDWHLDVLKRHAPAGGTVVDIGGGWGTFSLGAAALGYRSILIDDNGDAGWLDESVMHAMENLYAKYRVECVVKNVVSAPLGLPSSSVDMVTSFDSLEHWHASPRRMLHEVVDALKPGGWFFLGVPNCVNLRKRLTVPFGYGKWSSMSDWYETPVFRSHVREPDVDDLRYIARDMGLIRVQVYGRNWQGMYSSNRITRGVTPFVDHLLRQFPTVCADIYVLGQRPPNSAGR